MWRKNIRRRRIRREGKEERDGGRREVKEDRIEDDDLENHLKFCNLIELYIRNRQ